MVLVIGRLHWASLIAIMASGVVAGCGAGGAQTSAARQRGKRTPPISGIATPVPPAGGSGRRTIPTPGPTGIPADPAAVAVIRAWSDALRQGDVRRAATYFALPSLMINGPDSSGNALVTPIDSRAAAQAANEELPCGAKFISADRRGRYVNALFRLTNRPGPDGGCGTGTGQTARTNFVITDGRIVQWIRAPDDPGDNAGGPTTPAPAVPSTPQTSGPNV
jgi:hypothetical protein